MIQIKKVIEHVYEKFFGNESSGSSSTPGNDREPSTVESEDVSQIAHSKIELYCNSQVMLLMLFLLLYMVLVFVVLVAIIVVVCLAVCCSDGGGVDDGVVAVVVFCC